MLNCPICGQPPREVMCWIAWNVKCDTPGCVGYPHLFLSREDTAPKNPFDVAHARWNAWVLSQRNKKPRPEKDRSAALRTFTNEVILP